MGAFPRVQAWRASPSPASLPLLSLAMTSLQRAECLTGPFNNVNNGTSQSGWYSASLEMREDGTFCLDLWNFYESWDYIPEDENGMPTASSTVQEFPKGEDEAGVC